MGNVYLFIGYYFLSELDKIMGVVWEVIFFCSLSFNNIYYVNNIFVYLIIILFKLFIRN